MHYYTDVLSKYAVFQGRARRSEYWMFTLINIIVSIVIAIIAVLIRVPILSTLYGLAILIPGLAVCVRRLHDTNRSGWWFFLIFIPLIGAIILIVFFAEDSQPGDNKYGLNPKAVTPATPTV